MYNIMDKNKRRVYYLYLSTLISTGVYKCDKTNLASCKWNIDWARIFPNDVMDKDCIVRIKLLSEEVVATTLTYDAHLGTVRASFAFYNTREEVDIFIAAVEKSINMLK